MSSLRWVLAAFAVTIVAAASLLAQSGGVTYVGHEQVNGCVKGGTLVKGPDHLVQCSNRTGPGVVEIHTKETDVIYVIDGEATFVTGGKSPDAKAEADPNQLRGSSIAGGDTRHLTKGDVVVVPAGTPHWFKEVPKSVAYYVVKVLKP
jgi:mannose-6-phosphate isomerase-like protein (cupin superfamily)